ncbi:MAG: GNAT family N-acetyltransferase [Gammaproteobacteria bacterium]|nr:MAG: GNAT family N-acetyltransferase [Gammaproteobacteria bacterium]
MNTTATLCNNIDEVSKAEWNALNPEHNPFLRHEFLRALERHHCVGEHFGWLPRHVLVRDQSKRLIGAAPMYIKTNSYGEFVFDWNWADAYQRSELSYYPKLVIAIPYTPATGPRLMVNPDCDEQAIRKQLMETAIGYGSSMGASSLHALFTNDKDTQSLESHGLGVRIDCQFQWKNDGYRSFDDFLGRFTAHKRKKIKRERRRVRESNIEIVLKSGNELDDHEWQSVYRFYSSTFNKKFGYPTLTLDFFREIGRTMGNQILIALARDNNQDVAAAICFKSLDTLYGRHWGCARDYHSLHFELCYYQGLEYCIDNGLQHFDPGVQGEHKISRGFLPTITRSAHWIEHEPFRVVINDFLRRETRAIRDYYKTLCKRSPYKDPLPSLAPTHPPHARLSAG